MCDFFGYTFTDIRKHIERKHQDIKTLICDKCNKHLKNEVAMKVSFTEFHLVFVSCLVTAEVHGNVTSFCFSLSEVNLPGSGQRQEVMGQR